MYSLNLLFLSAVFGVMLSKTVCLPALAAFSTRSQTLDTNDGRDWNQSPAVQDMEGLKLVYDLTRPTRHADGLFTSGYSKLLGQLSAKDYLDSLIAKRVNGDLMEDQLPVKRHSDAVFTDNYSRYRNQMAVKKYLNSVLAGKRSVEDPSMTEMSIRTDPASQQTSQDVSLEDILNHLTLAL